MANHVEDDDQAALFKWAALYDSLRWMHSSLNGAFLNGDKIKRARQMSRLKKQGAKSGVWDVFLPVPKQGYHGLYIEMKAGKNDLTENQREFGAFVMSQGYACEVCYGFEEAINLIKEYMEI